MLKLLKCSDEEMRDFVEFFLLFCENVKFCWECGNLSDIDCCSICENLVCNYCMVCVVEDICDVMVIEFIFIYRGIYYVLGVIILLMDGVGFFDLFF